MSSAVFGKRTEGSPAHALAPSVARDLIRLELERIVASRAFQNAKTQRSFVVYAVERVLAGCADEIKEYSVGIEVFQRGATFDPRLDPIVRIQARSVRARLAKYYETEGKNDQVEIVFPKGTYAPIFAARKHAFCDENIPNLESVSAIPDAPVQSISTVAEPSALGYQEPDSAAHLELHAENHGRGVLYWKIGALALVIFATALLGAYFFNVRNPRAVPLADMPSIAILPFQNQSDDKADEFFSDGLTDDLIDSFARLPGIRVVARTSVYQFKGKAVDVRTIARELNVRRVLEGSVRRYGDRVRITAQLEDAATGYALWSGTYDRNVQDILGIQREISQIIADTLGVKLATNLVSPHMTTALAPAPLADNARVVLPEAYEDYLRGRYFFDRNSLQGFETAMGYFQQAIAKDPGFALAYMGLAHCYVQAIAFVDNPPPTEMLLRAVATANKALQLDATLGEAHLDLAITSEFTYDWPAAEREFQEALRLSPGDFLIHVVYSNYLVRTSLPQDALDEAKLALQLNPVSPTASAAVGRAQYYAGHFDEALEQYRLALQLDPTSGMTHLELGEIYIDQGMYSKGLVELEAAQQFLKGGSSQAKLLGLRGYAYSRSGGVTKARQILNKLLEEQQNSPQPLPAVSMAYVYIGLGNKDSAFRYLQKAISQKEADVLLLNMNPIYASLRSDPRFTDLRQQLHL